MYPWWRYSEGILWDWTDELVRYSIVIVAAIGGGTAYHKAGGLVSFDLVQTHIHGVPRLIVELIVNTIVLGFGVYILMNSIQTVTSPSIIKQVSIGLGISMKYPYYAIVIGMIFLIITAIEKYFIIFQDFKNGEFELKTPQLKGGEQA